MICCDITQLEERVVVLLGCWDRWSLFPSSYLAGLEAFFFLSEADYIEIKEQERGVSDAGAKEDYESLKRRAKLSGVAISDESTAAEVGAKMAYVEKYIKAKSLRGKEEEEEEFSITMSAGAKERERGGSGGGDSMPKGQGPPGMVAALRWASVDRGQEKSRDAEDGVDHDDLDGMPMGAAVGTGRADSADSDIDGEEYDGLDGAPLPGYGIQSGAGAGAGLYSVDASRQSSSVSGTYQGVGKGQGGERVSGDYDDDDDDDDVDGVPLDCPIVPNNRDSNNSNSNMNSTGNVPGKRRRNSEDDSRIKTKSNRREKDKSRSEKYASDSTDSESDKGPGRIDFL